MKFVFISCVFTLVFAANAESSQVLVYNGSGASAGDVSALIPRLEFLGYSYTLANEAQMNTMSRAQYDEYGLILWPGGDSIAMGSALSKETTGHIHDSIVLDGVSYLGFCAGAFMAETSSLYNTFKLATTYFNFYDQGAIGVVNIAFPGGMSDEIVYWDGPQLSGWGQVVAKYPSGDPAIVQDFVGRNHGFVMLSGVHPEAPLTWDVPGYVEGQQTPDNTVAVSLVSAALNKAPLSHY
jgi:glutamine amidotransferase-like uncharacterized protein